MLLQVGYVLRERPSLALLKQDDSISPNVMVAERSRSAFCSLAFERNRPHQERTLSIRLYEEKCSISPVVGGSALSMWHIISGISLLLLL